jgi:RNA polymerase sigma-70 factor (ECF subfamily)
MLGWGPEVEDVVQEVYLEVYQSLPRFRGEATFGTWLFRVTHNVAVSHLRRRGSRPVDLSPIKVLSEAVHQPSLDARDQVRALYAALDQVAPESREAFVLYELEGLTLSAIAEVTGDPLNTVASRVRRTRERLRRMLERGRDRRRRAR